MIMMWATEISGAKPKVSLTSVGPRPDHINDPSYDPKSIDLPGLELLGQRQEKFLPAWAPHLCGDQHLAVVVKHRIEEFGDGPYGFTSPALVNTSYGRWWNPLDEKPGPNPVPNSRLPSTADFKDGLGNPISMLAYANPENIQDEKQRADGYGLIRFDKKTRKITFECWPRFSRVADGDKAQFPGWPITITQDATGEVLYTVRTQGGRFHPRVYSTGKHTVKIGPDKPDAQTLPGFQPRPKAESGQRVVKL